MLKKSLVLVLISSLVACQSAQVSRNVASESESSDTVASSFREIVKGDDFEAIFQRALGAGYTFNDDPYFRGYKRVTAPYGQLPKEYSDFILLMKVAQKANGVQEVTLITTTESRAKEHKTLSTVKIKFSAEQGDVVNRLNWEEGISGLAASTLRALQQEKDAGIAKKTQSSKCIAFTIAATAVVGLIALAIIYKPTMSPKYGNTKGEAIAILILFPLAVGGLLGGAPAHSACTGAPLPNL